MSGELIVRAPGALSLVQDSGRAGFQRFGVSESGAIDRDALLVGNLLVGNDIDPAAVEVTFGGAQFQFSQDSLVAITGGDLQPSLDGTPLEMWESFWAPAGSTLSFAAPVAGLRAYLAVNGGIATEPVLESRSTHLASGLGGLAGSQLAAGDRLPVGDGSESRRAGAKLPHELRPDYGDEITVRVVPGPQQDQFTDAGMRSFFESPYKVTESSDRQGLRLDGPAIESVSGSYDIVSDAVVFGSVQVPGDGKPIVLLADRQTTGGYAKIGVVATVDLPLLAQAGPDATVRFAEVSVVEAQRLMRERRRSLVETDLYDELVTTETSVSLAGTDTQVNLSYRPTALSTPGGGLVSANIGTARSTVRVEDIE